MADEQKMSASEKKKEDWMNSKWRPMMGWMYMIVCFMDMVVFPILWSLVQTIQHQTLVQWNPLTLQGAGLFHIAMGAVLGIAAYGRTQEKLGGANNGGLQSPTPSINSTPSVSAPATIPAPSFNPSPIGSAPKPVVAPRPVPVPPSPSQFDGDLHPDDPPVRNTRND